MSKSIETIKKCSYLNKIKQLTEQSKVWLCVVGRNWCIKRKAVFLLAAGERERGIQRCPGLGSVADNSQGVDWTISLRKPKCGYPKIRPRQQGLCMSLVFHVLLPTGREDAAQATPETVLVPVTGPFLILNSTAHILAYSSVSSGLSTVG